MPHFTVVPVEDKHRAEYDSVEGLSWVDYRESVAAPAPGDSYDTVSSDGHGNHKENSPFLKSSEADKGGDYYDRNLALFEEELDIRPKVSSLLGKLVNYTNLSQSVKEHEEAESTGGLKKKLSKIQEVGECQLNG